jgi:hypothetical protein
MRRQKKSDDWGFPRWRPYGKGRDTTRVRTCDRDGCDAPGDRPAPKAPNSRERWYFCETHAAEYNRNWNYFEGLDAKAAADREAEESGAASAFRHAQHWQWGGPGDGSRTREEIRAFDALELDSDSDFGSIKAAYRRLAKENHPDVKPGDHEAAKRFQQVKAAYDVLRRSEERREGKPR